MARESVFGVKLLPSVDKMGMAQVTSAIKKGIDDGFAIDNATALNLEKMSRNAAEAFNKTIADAKKLRLGQSISDDLIRGGQELQTQLRAAAQELIDVQKKLSEGDITADQAKARQRDIKERLEALDEMQTREMKGLEKIIARRQRLVDDYTERSATENAQVMAEAFGDSLDDVWRNISSGDLQGLGKSLAGAIGKAGAGMETAGAAGAAGGASSSVAGIGAALGSVAAAAAALLAVVAVLAVIIKVMMDADAQAKEFNKTILSGAGAADVAYAGNARGVMELEDTLDAARESAMGLAWEFRGDAKEIAGVISAANEAGLTMKEMTTRFSEAGDAQEAFTKFTRTAIVYSKTLGQSMEDIATQSAEWMHDLGGGLETVQKGFGAIFTAAMSSGISTKRFYTMVTGATSGMALYNARIEDAAALVSELSEALGEDQAGAFVSDLAKGFTDQSYVERFKTLMIAGQDDVQDIMATSAERTASTFMSRLRDINVDEAGTTLADKLGGMLSEAGVQVDIDALARGDQAAIGQLANMSEKQLRQVTTSLRGQDAASARQFEMMARLAKGVTGGLGDQAKAMDELDMGGKLALMLQTLGDTPLSELSAVELAAFESYAGISGEQLKVLRRVDGQMRGNFEAAERTLEAVRQGNELTQDEKEDMARQFGLVVEGTGENAKLVTAAIGQNGEIIKGSDVENIGEYLQTQGDALGRAVQEPMSAQEAMAKEMVSNTESIANNIQTGIQIILEKIYDVMQMLYFFEVGNSEEMKAKQQELLEQSRMEQEGLLQTIEEQRGYASEARQAVATAATPEARAEAEVRLATLEGIINEKETMLEAELGRERDIMAGRDPRMLAAKYTDMGWVESAAAGGSAVGAAIGFDTEVGRDLEAAEAWRQSEEGRIADVERAKGGYTPEELLEQGKISQDTFNHIQQGVQDQVEAADGTTTAIEDLNADSVSNQVQAMEIAEARAIAKAATGTTRGEEFDKVYQQLRSGKYGEVMSAYGDNRTVLEGLSRVYDPARTRLEAPEDDFIYRGGSMGGIITPINRADDLLGAKPGGAVDRLAAGIGGRRRGGVVHININGGDTAKIYEVVKRAIRESGIRPPPGRLA